MSEQFVFKIVSFLARNVDTNIKQKEDQCSEERKNTNSFKIFILVPKTEKKTFF